MKKTNHHSKMQLEIFSILLIRFSFSFPLFLLRLCCLRHTFLCICFRCSNFSLTCVVLSRSTCMVSSLFSCVSFSLLVVSRSCSWQGCVACQISGACFATTPISADMVVRLASLFQYFCALLPVLGCLIFIHSLSFNCFDIHSVAMTTKSVFMSKRLMFNEPGICAFSKFLVSSSFLVSNKLQVSIFQISDKVQKRVLMIFSFF